jgi:hypothetical protein
MRPMTFGMPFYAAALLLSACSQGSGDDSAPAGDGTANADVLGNGPEHSACHFTNSNHGCGPGLTCRLAAREDVTPHCEKPAADSSWCQDDLNCASQFCKDSKCTAVIPMGFGAPCSDRWKDCTTDSTHLVCRTVGGSAKHCVPDEPTCYADSGDFPCCHSDSECLSQYCARNPTGDDDTCVGPPAQSAGQGKSCNVLPGALACDTGMFCRTYIAPAGGTHAEMCEPLLKQNETGCASDGDCDQAGSPLKCSSGTCVSNQ